MSINRALAFFFNSCQEFYEILLIDIPGTNMIDEKIDKIRHSVNCDETSDFQLNDNLTPTAKEKGNEVGFWKYARLFFMIKI